MIKVKESGGKLFKRKFPVKSVRVKPSNNESLNRTARTDAFSIGLIPVESKTRPETFIFWAFILGTKIPRNKNTKKKVNNLKCIVQIYRTRNYAFKFKLKLKKI